VRFAAKQGSSQGQVQELEETKAIAPVLVTASDTSHKRQNLFTEEQPSVPYVFLVPFVAK